MFRIGQKVVFIGPRHDSKRMHYDCVNPVVGTIYTVRSIYAPPLGVEGPIGLRSVEIVNAPKLIEEYGLSVEIAFWEKCFRPLVESKTDIGFAHEILRKATRKRKLRSPVVSVNN